MANQISKTGVKREQADTIADVTVDPVTQKNENLTTRECVYDACKVLRSRVNASHVYMCTQETWIAGMGIAVTGALFAGGLFF